MPDDPKQKDAGTATPSEAPPRQLWVGTGLCCEAQGDGVPCQGTDGECEKCGKALPMPADG